uniref:RRM domain-containing protein n=1 Tax=Acrobeloides nanus TaxID=290746 RepID=A0A914DR58_9BILA
MLNKDDVNNDVLQINGVNFCPSSTISPATAAYFNTYLNSSPILTNGPTSLGNIIDATKSIDLNSIPIQPLNKIDALALNNNGVPDKNINELNPASSNPEPQTINTGTPMDQHNHLNENDIEMKLTSIQEPNNKMFNKDGVNNGFLQINGVNFCPSSTISPATAAYFNTYLNSSPILTNGPTSLNNIVDATKSIDLNSIVIQPLNKNGVPDKNINGLNPSSSNPEPQTINTGTPMEQQNHLNANDIVDETNTSLYIRRLQTTMTDEALKEICEQHGKIVSINIIKDIYTNECKGYGFVKFETHEAARSAIQGLKEVNIHAEFAKKRGPKPKNKTPQELFEQRIKRLENLRKAQTRHRQKKSAARN